MSKGQRLLLCALLPLIQTALCVVVARGIYGVMTPSALSILWFCLGSAVCFFICMFPMFMMEQASKHDPSWRPYHIGYSAWLLACLIALINYSAIYGLIAKLPPAF